MKQSFMKTLTILTLGLIIGLAGCNHDPADEITLTTITLDTTNVKKVFTVGDEFTTEGLVVTAVYSDETTKEVTGWTVSETDLSKPAEKQTITISYTEDEKTVTATYTIEVKDKAAADPDDPEKKDPENNKDPENKDPENKDPEDSGNKDPAKKDPGAPESPEDPAPTSSFEITLDKNNELPITFSSKEKTLYFEVPAGYKSYAWYLNGKLEEEKSNKYTIVTDELAQSDPDPGILRKERPDNKYSDGLYEILVVVEDSNGEYYSATATFVIHNSSNYYN